MSARRNRLTGVDDIEGRPPRIGKLKIGEVKTTVKEGRTITYPSKLDYILAKDGNGDRVEAFHLVYGERPKEFLAVFPYNEPDKFYWEAYRRYGSGSGILCHGDGKVARVEETGEEIACPCRHAEPTTRDGKEYPPACHVTASCSLWLWEVPELGTFQIDTSGFRSISNMKWFIFDGLPGLTGTEQRAGIPLRVSIEAFQATHNGKVSTAYQWKFGLAPGMKPADVHIAAEKAIAGFVLPQNVQAQLDESKPADLYVGIPAETGERPDDADPGVCLPAPSSVPEEYIEAVALAESAFFDALDRSGFPAAKAKAALSTLTENRAKTDDWDRYLKWVASQTAKFERAATEAAGQGALV